MWPPPPNPLCVQSVITDYWLYLSAWLLPVMSKPRKQWGAKAVISFAAFPVLSQLSGGPKVHSRGYKTQRCTSPTPPLPALSFNTSSLRDPWEGIDSPPGKGRCVSPSVDWIDNAELNIALRQGARDQDIFRSVYGATTWTLLQLNDQTERRRRRKTCRSGGHQPCFIERLLHLVGLH